MPLPNALPPQALVEKLGFDGGGNIPDVQLDSMSLGYEIGAGGYLGYTLEREQTGALSINGATNVDLDMGRRDLITKLESLHFTLTGVAAITMRPSLVIPSGASAQRYAEVKMIAAVRDVLYNEHGAWNNSGAAALAGLPMYPHAIPPGWLWRLTFVGGGAGDTVSINYLYATAPGNTQMPRV